MVVQLTQKLCADLSAGFSGRMLLHEESLFTQLAPLFCHSLWVVRRRLLSSEKTQSDPKDNLGEGQNTSGSLFYKFLC